MARSTQPSHHVSFSWILLCAAAIALVIPMAGCVKSKGGGGVTALLEGNITLPGQGVIGAPVGPPSAGPPQASLDINGATVEALDADGNVVTSATTDTFGHYSLRLPSGSYQIRVRVGTTEYFTPLPAPVIARGLEIDGATDVAGTKTLDFEVPAPADTVAGTITAGGNPVSAAIVEFVDAEAEAVRYTATSAADGSFSVPVLPLGRFLARVDAATLPAGFAAPTPINLAVTASGVSPISLAFTLPAAIPVTGAVSTTSGIAPAISLAPDGSPQPPLLVEVPLVVEAGATIIISEIGYGEIARVVVQSDGTFDLNLRDGSYLLEFEGFGNGVVAPPPVRITVKNGLIYTDDQDLPIDPGAGGQIGALAHDVSATLTGSVTRGGSAVVARVVAVNSATGGIVASTDTTETGTYSLPLADGSYSVAVLSTFLPPGVIAPRPVRVGVEAGADPTNPIKEDAGVVDDGIVDFTLTSASVTLAGTVSTTGGTALMDIRVRALKGGEPVAQGVTSADGTYVLQLPLGTVDIEINPESVPPGLLSPDPLRVEVATAAGVTTITGPAGTIASLDWALDARTPNVNGTVRFDFNGDDVLFADEVVGCRIVVIRPDTGEFIFDTPSGPVTGTYSLILKNGTYIIGVDTESLPPGSAPPPAHALSVTDAGVTLADGTAAPAVNVDFTLMRRAATLTGVVVLNGTGTAVGLQLIDLASGTLVTRVGSAPVSGEYRMSMFPGTYEFRVDPDTLPAGTAIPAPVELSVAADGTISTPSGIINSLAVTLTRNVATLTGIVTVTRGGVTAPVEVEVQARDPQDHGILQGVLSDPETGAYTLLLLPGSYAIAIDPASIPPGVLPPPPVVVTVSGTTVSGPGVAGNVLDLTLEDLRQGGVDITGLVFDSGSGNGLFAELRLFDPINGSVDENFILSVASDATGQFSFRAVDGIYRLAILPETLPPTAVPPPGATLSVQGNNIIENNIIYVTNPAENAQNDGIINFEIQDGATSGIRIVGVVAENGNPIPSAFVMVVDAATGDIVAETVTDAAAGSYTLVLPLGGYFLGVHPDSLPFTLIPPPPVSVLATSTGGVTTVTTDGGQVVNPDGNGDYVFDFTPVTASQSLSGTVQNSIGGAERVFLQVLDGYDGSPVTGRWSDIATGGYVIQLSPGSYEVGIDPPSVPFGAVAPPPVAITVTDTGILEANGTPDDGVVDFTILAAGRTISGTVTDSNGNPFACFAGALDALTDEFVQGAPTMPATGAYGFSVPEGTYKVGIDPGSLPPGFLVPPMVTVQVTNVDVTVDFVIDDATQCITGTVVTATGGIPLPAFVFLRDASTDQFITGFPTAPGSGAFDLCAAPGFYELLLDPGSLPPGTIAPPPVAVQVTDLAILEDNTAGAGNVVNDGTVNFLVTDTPINNLAQLTGTVTFQSGGQSFPLGAFVFLEEASTHQFLNGVFSDPGSGGSYSMLVPDGTYQVLVDPGTLPPGVALPPPVLITVSGTTITQQTDGLPVVSSQLDFVLSTAENTISGTVTLAGNGFSCFVIAMDPTTDLIVMGAPVDPQGNWSMGLPDGTYRIKVDPPSLPPGIMAPAGVIVSASSGLIIESAGTANDGIIPFVLTQSQSTLSGYVEDSGGARMYAFVLAFNSVDGQIVAVSPTGPNELFTLPLFDGDFDIVVDPPSLPLDSVPPVPSRVNVSGATITLTNAGSGAIDGNGDLAITVTQQNQAVSVPIAVEDGAGNPMPGAVRVLDSFGNLLFIFGVPPQPGGVPLLLGDGTFVLELEPASVPPGFSLPAPTTVAIAGGIATPANVTFSLSLPLLTGTIFNAVSGGTTLLALDLLNGEGMVLNSGVPLVQSGSDATYQVNLGDGTYLLSFRRANGVGSAQVLVPQPVTVNVAGGVIQNPDSDPVAAGVQIDIDVPQIMGTAAGTVTLN
ncbi:MAG: collagen binding domain-containing protein, partial [Planctomycetota bacterium]